MAQDEAYQQAVQRVEAAQQEGVAELDLSEMGLTEVPEAIAQLQSLQSLNLRDNQITEIPEAIGQLQSLLSLHLRSNQITVIPEAIAQLQSLQSLYLGDNRITEIPEAITQLKSLQFLSLWSNRITVIPEAIAQLQPLRFLHLSRNQITVIPEAIAQLQSLLSLNLDSNQIRVIPEAIAQLQSLQSLDLSHNQIRVIPETIAQLQSLQSLDLGGNRITEIPEAIAQLQSLQSLYLGGNQITEIPETIAQLQSLQSLYLGGNRITEIPEAIAQLQSLQSLDLGGNRITEIPEAIAQLANLKRLVLGNNPITNVPSEIIRKGWGEKEHDDGDPQAIFTYLKATAKAAKRPLNELKVLLVGEGDVGKTSLLKQLLSGTFNPQETKTPGINIEQWRLPERPNLRLNLWDFGGQRVMHTTHQFFLTKRSLYLLVLDNRKNEQQNRAEYWLKLIETYGGNSPVILVGNCADEHPPEVKIRTLKKKYPQITTLIATSCKTGEGIEALCQEIARQIDRISHVQDELPVTWFEIKTQLEAMQSTYDFISYEKYQELCHRADVTTAADQKVLAEFLHDLGIILNFQDDSRLNETNVLNPEWVTAGVYDILNNHELMLQHKGILSLPNLGSILQQPNRYPDNKRSFLMGLMEKFELCFPLDGYNPPRYLISDLLPIDEPDVDDYETAPLHFQYRYDILPGSIISRFIVRNHAMIYKTMRWRSGVVLTQDSGKALIRSDEEDGLISIKAQGARASALLATIRADFTKIHATIPNLPVQEFLVVRELQNGQPTGREVPVDYLYLNDLDRQGTIGVSLPNLKGKYNLRTLLEGVESREQREKDLSDRQERSRSSRDSRPLRPQKPQRPNLLQPGLALLFILGAVAAIFAVLAHSVPFLQLALIVIAIVLVFAFITLVMLLRTGTLSGDAFNQSLEGFWKSIPLLKGQEPEKNTDSSSKEPAANSEKPEA